MSFDRTRLPDPIEYYENLAGLRFKERGGKWRTAACHFHGGSDSLRINTASGGYICMSCGAGGGDVLAYHMAAHGLEFVQAAQTLGAWLDDGKPAPKKAAPFSTRDGLLVLQQEAQLVAVAAANLARGVSLSDADKARLMTAAGRIAMVKEACHA